MIDKTLIKVISVATSVIGLGLALVSDWVNEQKMDEKIEEKVNKAFAKRTEDES